MKANKGTRIAFGLSLMMGLSLVLGGCQITTSATLMGSFESVDSLAHEDVGIIADADFAPLLSQYYHCEVTEDMLMTDYVFDEDDPDRDGSFLIINRTTNTFVAGSKSLSKRYPASITKMMTALVVLQNCGAEEVITINEKVANFRRGSCADFKEGDRITVDNLLGCLLVVSANNAAIGFADYISGSEEAFVALMNETAAKLGMRGSHFVNSHGMHDVNHYSTPYDMYLLMQECLKYPVFNKWMNASHETYEYVNAAGEICKRQIEATNQFKLGTYALPEGYEITASKTGTTNQAGYCLNLCVESPTGNNYLIGVYRCATEEKLYNKIISLIEAYCE